MGCAVSWFVDVAPLPPHGSPASLGATWVALVASLAAKFPESDRAPNQRVTAPPSQYK